MAGKLTVAPPTRDQLDKFKKNLERALFIEHAASLAGIPSRVVTEWIRKGRAGHVDFVEFVDIIDDTSARQAARLMDAVMLAATDGDLNAIKWIYTQRFSQREKRLTDKWLDAEDALDATEQLELTDEAVAEAEARALAALEEVH